MKNGLLKFCIKLFLFAILLFVIDRGVGATFVAMKDLGLKNNPENMWLKTPYVLEKVETDVVIIGSSRASHHYIPQMITDSLGLSAYNCGQDGCFFLYQNYIINMLLDRYQPKMIIWDIQPGSFNLASPSTEYQNLRYLSPYYATNKWAQEYIQSESPKMKYRMMSRMFAYNSKLLNYIFPLITTGSKTENGYLPLENEGYEYPTKNKVNGNVPYERYAAYLDLLANTIDRCNQLNVDLELYISPTFSDKNNAVVAAENAIAEVAKAHNVTFHNYNSYHTFMEDASCFKDAVHLNDKGARKFTEITINNILK